MCGSNKISQFTQICIRDPKSPPLQQEYIPKTYYSVFWQTSRHLNPPCVSKKSSETSRNLRFPSNSPISGARHWNRRRIWRTFPTLLTTTAIVSTLYPCDCTPFKLASRVTHVRRSNTREASPNARVSDTPTSVFVLKCSTEIIARFCMSGWCSAP